MHDRMSKRPVIVSANGTQKLERISLSNGTFQEDWMQRLLESEPSILPTAEIDPIFSPLICIAREVYIGVDDNKGGRIDNLYISPKGYVVIVETKLWRNPEARREVIGQILDYAKEVQGWDYEKLDSVYCDYHKDGSLFGALVSAGYKTPEDEAAFIDITEKNMKAARFLLMIVGDGIRAGVEKMADYMNRSPDMQHRIALCELEVYELDNRSRLVIPQLTTKTSIIERGIIRIENGEIKMIMPADEEREVEQLSSRSSSPADPPLSREDYISELTNWNKALSTDDVSTFLEDLEGLGFNIKFTPNAATINFFIAPLKTNIHLFRFPGKPKDEASTAYHKIFFVPAHISDRLVKLGYSEKIGQTLIDKLYPLLSSDQRVKPYEDTAKFYFLSDDVMSEKKSEFLGVLEGFKNNF